MKYDSMGERMKQYEANSDFTLPENSLWVMRLDGNNFSRFTKKIAARKPFDERIMRIMTEVCRSLAEKFNFVTVYTQSDEITCIPNLRPEVPGTQPIYGLRIQKLCSLVAAQASVVFYREFIKYFPEFTDSTPTFDARIFTVDCEDEIYNAFLWRQRDCIKNAKNLVGQQFYSYKRLNGVTSDEQIALVEAEQGISFESYPSEFRNGIFIKRRLVEVEGYNPSLGRYETSFRGLLTPYTVELTTPRTDLDWLMRKYGS